MHEESLHNLIREAESHLTNDSSTIGEYVDYSHHDTIEKIIAYLNSRHISGAKDSKGRDKPFFNIVTAAVNIWYRATDIDRKNIRFIPKTRSSIILAFIANVILQKWMDENRFGQFLNSWGRTLAQYGSAVVKFVEKKGELIPTVIPWNRLIVDPIDFDALPRIEKIYLTPAQLKKKKEYNQDAVQDLLDSLQQRENLDGTTKDLKNDFIELYEVHGELPVAHLKDQPSDEDWDNYSQQMHVLAYSETSEGEHKDFTLFSGREAKDPYMLTHLIEEDGRTLSIGAVEYLFDAQWMQNHTVKNVKDTLDLASKLIFQTSDQRYLGRNVLSAIETGDILIHRANEPLTQINNSKSDITAFQNFGAQWQEMARELTSTPDALRGNTLPSGTPYSLGAFLGTQSGGLFEIMTENKGLSIEDIMKTFVIPHIKKTLKNKDEILAILDSAGIEEIDSQYIPAKAIKNFNERSVESLLNGEVVEPFDKELEEGNIQEALAPMGNKRSFKPDKLGKKTWDELFSDFEWDNIRVEVTGENVEKQAVLQTLASLYTTTLQTDPVAANVILGKILTETGVVTPLEVANLRSRPTENLQGNPIEGIAQTNERESTSVQ